MADDSTPRRRRRWPAIIPLLGVLVWYLRSRSARAAGPGEGRPGAPPVPAALPAPGAPPVPVAGTAPGSVTRTSSVSATRTSPAPPLRRLPAAAGPPAAEPPAAEPLAASIPPDAASPATAAEEPAAAVQPLLPPAATVIDPSPSGEGAAQSPPDGSPPGPDYTIKGNAGSMLFHPPSSPYYKRTKAEVWFRTPEEARAAGFTEWTPRRRAPR